jgi:type IV secretory pathway TrbD component
MDPQFIEVSIKAGNYKSRLTFYRFYRRMDPQFIEVIIKAGNYKSSNVSSGKISIISVQ